MRLLFDNGEEIDLYTGSKIKFELINPMFNDIGSHTSSFNIPRTKKNNRLFGIHNKINDSVKAEFDVFIQLKSIKFVAELNILNIYNEEFKVFLAFHSGYINKKNKDRKLKEVDYYGGQDPVTGTQEARYRYFNKKDWDPIKDGFAVFPVYLPEWYSDNEDEEFEWSFLYEGETKPMTVGYWYRNIVKGFINKNWSDYEYPDLPTNNFWEISQIHGDSLVRYIQGAVVPFPFLSYVLDRIFLDLGLNITRSIFFEYEELKRLHIFNNYDIAAKSDWYIYGFDMANHVPNMTITEFFKQLKTYLGLFIITSLDGSESVVTNFMEIVDSSKTNDISTISHNVMKIENVANKRLIFNFPKYVANRAYQYINGYFRTNVAGGPQNEAREPLSLSEGNGQWQFDDSGNGYWEMLPAEFVSEQLSEDKATTIDCKAHTLGIIHVAYILYNDYWEYGPSWAPDDYWFYIDMPYHSEIKGATGFNNYDGILEDLILLYNSDSHYSGNVFKTGGNFGSSYPIDGYGNSFGERSLHLDKNGVIEGWQKDYINWLSTRKKIVDIFIGWKEKHLTNFMFSEKYKIKDSLYLINKIKGEFIAGGETVFKNTELFSL